MKKLKILPVSAFVILISLVLAHQAGAFSIKELLGLGEDEQEQAATNENNTADADGSKKNWAKPSHTAGSNSINLTDIQKVLTNMEAAQRENIMADETLFRNLVQQEADNLSVLSAARQNKVDTDANTLFLMQRGAENILRESYLGKLITSKLPADFPSDEQVKEYYEKNKESFVLTERVHVWQVFLEIPRDAGDEVINNTRKKAESITSELRKGSIDFSEAANTHSQHAQSKVNGGYMGLLKVTEILPAIKEPLLKLAEGKVSDPVRSDTGYHVLKRGTIIPDQEVNLDQVTVQIRNLLINQAKAQFRKAVYEQARATYPVDIKEGKIEEWRLRLRTNLENTAAAGTQ